MKDLYIVGAGGFGREVAWLVEKINSVTPTWNLKGFIDDDSSCWNGERDGYKVLGGVDYLRDLDNFYVVCAIGTAETRKRVIKKLEECPNVCFATLVDPSVMISKSVTVGQDVVICAGTIITVDVSIGNHCIINLDCTIGHDVIIQDYVTLYPSVNVSGNTILESCVELGTGAQIIQGKKVESGTIIGAGAVVVTDMPNNCTAVGIPAKSIKINHKQN